MVIFKVAGSTILIILNSYLLLVGRYYNHHQQKVFPRSLKHFRESNNGEKYFSRACIKAR